MAEQIVGGSRIELEAHYVRIFLNNYPNSDFINRVSGKSTIKLVFSPEEKTVNLDGTLIYVSDTDNSKFEAAKHKKLSFSYSVPMDSLSRLQIKSSRKGKKSDNNYNYTNTFSFTLTKSDARRLFTDLQMGHKAIKKRFKTPRNNMSKSSNSNSSSFFYKRQRQLKTVVIYLDKLPQKDLQDLSKIFYFISKIKMDKLSLHTLLYGDKSGNPTPQQRSLKKTLKFSKELISKMTILDETKSDGLIISENLEISFHEKRILFYVIYNDTRIEHSLEGTQILGFELINSENSTSIHLAVEQLEARKICSKLIRPAPKMQRITMMIAKFVKAENKGKMEMKDQCTIRIHFKELLNQEQIEHLKHIFPVIGKFPTSPEEEHLNFENDEVEVMDNDDDEDLLNKIPSDQELSEVEEEDEELKPLNLDIKKLKIGQHTICYSSTKFNHYITLIVDDGNLRIIGNGQISQYIEEKVYFYFKIPINSTEIDREIEVNAVPGLKSRIKFSLSLGESNYVRKLFKKSLGFYGIDYNEVGLTRFEFILATELNGLQLAHLRSCIENLQLITKSEKKCVQVKTEIPEQMDMENSFLESREIETIGSNISVQFEKIYFGTKLSYLRNSLGDQILNLVFDQSKSTIKIMGDLKNKNRERIKFNFEIPMNKIKNLELKKTVTKRKNIQDKITRRICKVNIFVYPDDDEMEIIRKKLSKLDGCPLDSIRNDLEFSTHRTISKSYEDCERILQFWQNTRKKGTLSSSCQENIQTRYCEKIVLSCQSIHFGQYVYTGPNACHISKRSDNSTKVSIFMRDFEDKNKASLAISGPHIRIQENLKQKYFLSDYGVNYWILFFIPHQECQDSFASILKYPQLVNLFDPSSEDMEKSYIRLVFEFPPSLQEKEKKIDFCAKLNDIFDTYILSYLDLTAENNIKIIEKNLARKNNEMIMEMEM